MAVAAYTTWQRAGRPLTPAQPIRDIVSRMKAAYPRAASTFSWYANDAHYTAVPAEDHTPFSQTGWPLPCPQWVVCATDIMNRPDLGVDCGVLVPYWLAEARAGRTPWLKYLIWQATIYDVRNGWRPQGNSGHRDHAHISTRTDHINTSLGSWSLQPGGVTSMFCAYGQTGGNVEALQRLLLAANGEWPGLPMAGTSASLPGGPDGSYGDKTAAALSRITGNDGRNYGPVEYAILAMAVARRHAGQPGAPGKPGDPGAPGTVGVGTKLVVTVAELPAS